MARLLFAILLICLWFFSARTEARELRVCADPNNLPFSNAQGEGFENRIASLVARELGANLSYVWWPQRRGFIRNTLNAGLCDLVPGIASGIDMLRTTRPYYRSGYVFVTRADGPDVSSLDDPNLHKLMIGVQLVGDDGSNPPPAHALARRGIVRNVHGYSVYGDYTERYPAASIMTALQKAEIDVAIVWGPLAGYFARDRRAQLRLKPVTPEIDGPRLPMVFDISMGVRLEDKELREEVDSALVRVKPQIDSILASYGVPRLDY